MKVFLDFLEAPADRLYWYGVDDLDPGLAAVDRYHLDEREYFFGFRKADGSPKLLYRLLEDGGVSALRRVANAGKACATHDNDWSGGSMMREAMQAAIIMGPEQAGLTALPLPEPAPGEVVVRIEGCGVCASNIPLWEGRPWFNYPALPGAPGHEGWGRVHSLGAGVTGFSEGDRVTLLSYNAFAEYDKVPEQAVVKLPATLVSGQG